jgi:hypothetical protein
MTIKELIEKLSQIEDQEALVMTKGFEEGFNDISDNFRVVSMALNVYPEWFKGDHEMVSENHNYKDLEIVRAIVL